MGVGLQPEVLLAAQAGAGWGFERVFEALAPAVHGYLRAQGARDPESAVNEVFLRVHRRLPGFEGDVARFRSWVFVIAHNVVLDERRWHRRRPVEDAVADTPERPAAADTEDVALRRLADGRLRALLGTLSPDQRDVLLLRFVADLSLEQVAEATGRSVTAVKALQRRALDALRRRLRAAASAVDGDAVALLAGPVSRSSRTTFTST